MSLPSQSSRSSNSNTARFTLGSRRRATPARRFLGVVVVALVLLGGWWLFFSGGDEGEARDDAPRLATVVDGEGEGPSVATAGPITRRTPGGSDAPPMRSINGSNGGSNGGSSGGQAGRSSDGFGRASNSGSGEERPDADTPGGPPSLSMGAPSERAADRPAALPERRSEAAPQQRRPEAAPERAPVDARGGEASRGAVRPGGVVEALVSEANGAMEDGRIVAARDILNRALHEPAATDDERAYLRDRLAGIADVLTFSDRVVPGDAMCREYRVQRGDLLSTIARSEGTDASWKFIQRVNNITNPNRIALNQRLKIVQGPFHAVISKGAYRLDLFADERDSAGNRIFLRSMRVGLGEYDSTPVGGWIVKNRELNPGWVNPRDGRERYDRDDPENPIGEHWIGLRGTDPGTANEEGIGIHGTIEPETIGEQASMGCVRLLADDVELLYEVLMPDRSEVVITE
jgi:hypothetical protein